MSDGSRYRSVLAFLGFVLLLWGCHEFFKKPPSPPLFNQFEIRVEQGIFADTNFVKNTSDKTLQSIDIEFVVLSRLDNDRIDGRWNYWKPGEEKALEHYGANAPVERTTLSGKARLPDGAPVSLHLVWLWHQRLHP